MRSEAVRSPGTEGRSDTAPNQRWIAWATMSEQHSDQRTYVVRTYGCQMNEHDSERISGLLEADGLVRAESESDNIDNEKHDGRGEAANLQRCATLDQRKAGPEVKGI